MTHCIIEANVATSQVSYPFQRGWLNTPDWLTLRDRVTQDQIDNEVCALVDAATATKLLDSHSVVADVALVSTHRGPIAMRTTHRPDEVENAIIQLGDASPTAEALARSTIHHFYGIDVVDWIRSSQEADVTIIDGAETMRSPGDGEFKEDLVRAWFILTSLALPTHVFIAPKSALEQGQRNIEEIVRALRGSIAQSDERKREVRRNLSEDLEIDREQLTEFLNDQKTRLTKSSRKGWLDLINRVARAMNLPVGPNPDVVSFGLAGEE